MNLSLYILHVPPTKHIGDIRGIEIFAQKGQQRSEALKYYNKHRIHENLQPLKRLPKGTILSLEVPAQK